MLTISINEPELIFIELIRLALSEENIEKRVQAIKNVKQDVVAALVELMSNGEASDWTLDSNNAKLVQWVAKTSPQRHEAAHEFSQTARRYEDKIERKFNAAEEVGKRIWDSIQDEKFEGAHTRGGILQQVSETARKLQISGARDKDVLREAWKKYRGVVHLGMAIDYCEDNPDQKANVLHIAERFRQGLSENCPKGRSKPYVHSDDQISFVYSSKIWGPKFRGWGLPFNVD